uniref:Zinc finger MYM-type protein 1 n=1 Tax=Sipha flava TaxID=143950 RepID=A0A2S2R2F9_9HEMI
MQKGSFVIFLFILQHVLSSINILSNMFQDKTTTLDNAASKRMRREPNVFEDFILITTTAAESFNSTETNSTSVEKYYCVNGYFKILDCIVVNLKKRFSTESLQMAEAVDNFIKLDFKKSELFINHYKDLLDVKSISVQSEMHVVKNYLHLSNGKSSINLEALTSVLSKNIYPNMSKLIQVALTLPISSSTCERSFSAMRRIKTWLRSSMVQNRLKNLAIISIEKDISKKIDKEAILNLFAKKNRYIILK